ncbi:hypothetical protein TUBRATIS_14690 [Tubulinosema ratisbonensis]|uniref:Uncharacterized protein n=1 Tax=Tubulinosema ratisbonensis TaxID=291195 RepID=A0A437ALM8_9MICR|nr:hypothetical protein TUBRATIS_14690 [Tubulinosema ratisbonensis]
MFLLFLSKFFCCNFFKNPYQKLHDQEEVDYTIKMENKWDILPYKESRKYFENESKVTFTQRKTIDQKLYQEDSKSNFKTSENYDEKKFVGESQPMCINSSSRIKIKVDLSKCKPKTRVKKEEAFQDLLVDLQKSSAMLLEFFKKITQPKSGELPINVKIGISIRC